MSNDDENTMSHGTHENKMVTRSSPHSLRKKDRKSLLNLVEDVENARDLLK